jgi:hypothetical protein
MRKYEAKKTINHPIYTPEWVNKNTWYITNDTPEEFLAFCDFIKNYSGYVFSRDPSTISQYARFVCNSHCSSHRANAYLLQSNNKYLDPRDRKPLPISFERVDGVLICAIEGYPKSVQQSKTDKEILDKIEELRQTYLKFTKAINDIEKQRDLLIKEFEQSKIK